MLGFLQPIIMAKCDVGVGYSTPCGTLHWECRHLCANLEARLCLQAAAQKSTRTANRKRHPCSTFQAGQRVWLAIRDLALRLGSKQLAPPYIGPFNILRRINPGTYRLALLYHENQSQLILCLFISPTNASLCVQT